MMPNVAGDAATRRQIFVYTLLVAPVGVLPWLLGYAGMGYGLVAAALGAGFLWHAWSVLRMPAGDAGMRPAKAVETYGSHPSGGTGGSSEISIGIPSRCLRYGVSKRSQPRTSAPHARARSA